MVENNNISRKDILLKRLEASKAGFLCVECGSLDHTVEFIPLLVSYGEAKEKARKRQELLDFVVLVCKRCKRMLFFKEHLQKAELSGALEYVEAKPKLPMSRCVICGAKRFSLAFSAICELSPDAYVIYICLGCGAAYFFEEHIHYRARGGFRKVGKLQGMAAAFKCRYCGQQKAVAGRTTFGFEFTPIFPNNMQYHKWKPVVTIHCKVCKSAFFYSDE